MIGPRTLMSREEGNSKQSNEKAEDGALPKHPASFRLPVSTLRRMDLTVTVAQAIAITIAFFGSDAVRNVVAVGCSVVFVVGAGLFGWAFLIAAGRSRLEELTVAGAFFLAGSVDIGDRRWAYGNLLAQTIIGVVGGSADLYTTMAFGILVPMFGLGVIAFLGSAHGAFRPLNSTK